MIFRLGWLNMLNPTMLDGVYRLDLSRWEERQVAKILIHINVAEAGSVRILEKHDLKLILSVFLVF